MTYKLTTLLNQDGTYVAIYHANEGTPRTLSGGVYSEEKVLEVIFQITPDSVLLSGSKDEILGQ